MAKKAKVVAKKVKLSDVIGKIEAVVIKGTGEVVEVVDDLKQAADRPKNGRFTDFVKVDQQALLDWATNKSVDVYRVMMVLMGKMRYGGKVPLSQTEIGNMLGIQQENVSRAMKTLKRDGLVKMVKRGLWLVSHLFCFKGGSADLMIAAKEETDDQIAGMIKAVKQKAVDILPRIIVKSDPELEVAEFMRTRDFDESETGWFYDEDGPALAY